jgi:hypothetical protein
MDLANISDLFDKGYGVSVDEVGGMKRDLPPRRQALFRTIVLTLRILSQPEKDHSLLCFRLLLLLLLLLPSSQNLEPYLRRLGPLYANQGTYILFPQDWCRTPSSTGEHPETGYIDWWPPQ